MGPDINHTLPASLVCRPGSGGVTLPWSPCRGPRRVPWLTAHIWKHADLGRYRLRVLLEVDRDPHPGYGWVAPQEIEPIEVTAEFVVAAQ